LLKKFQTRYRMLRVRAPRIANPRLPPVPADCSRDCIETGQGIDEGAKPREPSNFTLQRRFTPLFKQAIDAG
jgi:hypothetical protein